MVFVECFTKVTSHVHEVSLRELPAGQGELSHTHLDFHCCPHSIPVWSKVGSTERSLHGEAVGHAHPPSDHSSCGLLAALDSKLAAGEGELGGALRGMEEERESDVEVRESDVEERERVMWRRERVMCRRESDVEERVMWRRE